MSSFLVDYPFANRLYPGSLAALAHVHPWGATVILSDGDVVFQPRKVQRSGLWEAVEGRVLIYIHKEQGLEDVERRYPARHYVMVDDKLRILTAMKKIWGRRLTTVWPRQGRYALDPKTLAAYPPPDLTVELIGDLVNYDLTALLGAMQVVAQRYGFEPESGVAIAREQISPHASKRGVRRRNSRGPGDTIPNVAIPSLPRTSRCFSCRDIDPDSTRFIECHCGGLSDCNRHTWSDWSKARQPMVVERMSLKRSSIGPLQIREDQ